MQLEVLEQWINPVYLDIGIQAQIRDQFEKESQIELPDFLLVNYSGTSLSGDPLK